MMRWSDLCDCFIFFVCSVEIAQLTSSDSGIAETPETDDSVSIQKLIALFG